MDKLTIILIIDFIALIFLGLTFGAVEKNEILNTEVKRKRNRFWHKTKFIFLVLIFGNISYTYYDLTIEALLLLIMQGSMVVLVFNPTINKYKRNSFFYLGENGFEGNFKKYEKIYYLVFFLTFISCLIWIK